MLPEILRGIASKLYVRAFRRHGVAIKINSRRYRVSSRVARGIPRRMDPPALRCWLELVRGRQAAIDAGANVGIWSVLAAAEMPAGARILAIEPSPVSYEILADCARVARGPARIIPVHGALSDHAGRARFTLDGPAAATNRLSTPSENGTSVEVPLFTLDALVAEQGLTPAVMKVDVEGAELLLLRGARATMREARPVVVLELHWGRELGATPQSLFDLTREYGYDVHDEGGLVIDSPETLAAQNFVILRPSSRRP